MLQNMRNETDACTSAQIPLQLELWIPENCDSRDEAERGETQPVVIDLVQDDESTRTPGVVVIEL